jgi:tRNA(Arg) A34 adenosine deaminase TadA
MRELFMAEAIRLAAEGVRRGDGGPFGAVVVRDGEIIGRGWNQVVAARDPTAHAEILAIRDACRRVGDFRLTGAELYTSCAPCPMCLAAAYWARLAAVWYAAEGGDVEACGFDDLRIREQLGAGDAGHLPVRGGLLREQALLVLAAWRRSDRRIDY